MKERNLGGYLVPSGDAHVSEYVSAADKRREWLTGFTGSAGTALITSDEALLWTDGRYFVQAAAQLKGSPWTLMKQNEPGVPDLEVWVQARQAKLRDTYGLKMRVGVDPRLISLSRADEWEAKGCMPLTYVSQNLLDLVWGSKQPAVARNPVVPHPLVYSGESAAQKIRRVGQAVAEAGGTALILNALDQICWLHNLRGSDIECNPVFLAYAILRLGTATPVPPEAGTRPPAEQLACFPCTPEGALSCGECNDAAVEYTVTLYVRCLDAPVDHLQVAQIRSHLAKEGCLPEERVVVELRPYASFGADEAAATAGAVGPPAGSAEPVVLLERMSCTPAMAASLAPAARKLVGCSPAEKFKACKNEAEIRGLVSAGRKDAAAIVSFLSWVTEAVQVRDHGLHSISASFT
jgi:Xaa-Pro aminopeptidase